MITWLASYPRSGNTFFRVLLNSVFNINSYSIYNDNDIGADEKTSDVVGHTMLPKDFDLHKARNSNEVYYIKTHEQYNKKIDPSDKVIYLIRDGRESTLSFMKHQNIYGKRNKTLLDTIYGDTWIGSWGDHVRSWEKFPKENILYIYFEELTDKPHEQISQIADFLYVNAIDNKIPTFDELKAVNPKFFRSGKKDSWKEAYNQTEHMAFWYMHHNEMKKHHYLDSMPKIFQSDDLSPLYRAINLKKKYTNTQIQSKNLITSCKQKMELNSLKNDIKSLINISFISHPSKKYNAYKKLLYTYQNSKNQSYTLLPTDDPTTEPTKQFCLSKKENPILIYQVGKVGSSAIYSSIKKNMTNLPVYQVHNIAGAQELLSQDLQGNVPNVPAHFTMGINLNSSIHKEPDIPWKIIIGIREPIARWVSDVFENIHTRYKFLKNADNTVNIEKTIQYIKDTLNEEPQEKWFDDEFLNTFGIDLTKKPFEGNSQIIHQGKLEILIYKFENMRTYLPEAIGTFLNIENFKLENANETSAKSTAQAYKTVKEQLKFDTLFLDTFYKKRVVSHFYTQEEIAKFKKQWS